MANFVTTAEWIVPTAYISSGAQSDFPASNVGAYTHPYRPWRSSGTIPATGGTTVYVGVDFGANVSLTNGAFVIDNINIASGTVQVATDAAFTSGAVAVAVTFNQDPVDGRYKAWVPGTTLGSKRYARVYATNNTTTDGSAYLSVGSMVGVSSYDEWDHNINQTYAEEFEEAYRENADFAGGGEEPVILGNPRAILTISSQAADRSTMRAQMLKVQRYGARPFVFYANSGDTSQVYIVRRLQRTQVTTSSPTTMESVSFVFREVV